MLSTASRQACDPLVGSLYHLSDGCSVCEGHPAELDEACDFLAQSSPLRSLCKINTSSGLAAGYPEVVA